MTNGSEGFDWAPQWSPGPKAGGTLCQGGCRGPCRGRNGAPARRPGGLAGVVATPWATMRPQWSPGPKAGGTLHEVRLHEVRLHAAMEPRPEGRGDACNAC